MHSNTERCTVKADVTPADELFISLDGTILQVNDTRWRVEIYGIHAHDDHHWIQLELQSDTFYSVTLRAERLSAARIRTQLLDWLSTLNSSPFSVAVAVAHA